GRSSRRQKRGRARRATRALVRRRRNFVRRRKEWTESNRRDLHMGLARLLPRPAVRAASASAYDEPAPTPTEVIALANHKGGVAKTTTTLNLGVAFSEHGYKVLLVDLDPQGNLTMSQGLNPDSIERSMYDVLVHRLPIEQVIEAREVDVAVSSIDLAG